MSSHDVIILTVIIHLVWVHEACLTLPLYIEAPVSSLEIDRDCICVKGVSNLPLCLYSVVFLFFYLLLLDYGYSLDRLWIDKHYEKSKYR